jgi:hypothetical protein
MKTKNFLNSILFLPVLTLVLFFASCQDEVIEIIQDAPDEVLVAESEVATLLQKTSSNDGSKDNIIDKSSCFNVVLPVHVFINGLELVIDSEEDFEVIEAIFDEFEDDDDSLDFIFPIKIVLADHTEVNIENQSQLEEYMAECSDDDDDIECIDFVYPISFSIFNSAHNLIETKFVHNDGEMYRFVKNIRESDIVSINFPIEVSLSDGTVLNIQNMMELKHAINEAADSCDEDDDNDFGDDDFTKERLDNLLVKCPWVVHDFRRNHVSLTDHYGEYLMRFYEDGSVKLKARSGDQLTGTWTTRVSDRGALIKLEFENLVDFSLEWFVHDISNGRIKLFTDDGNLIILKKNCDIVFDNTIERVENILKECFWRITRLNIDGVDNDHKYLGTPIKFENEHVVKLRVNGEFVTGSWEVVEINHNLVLLMVFEDRPELILHWTITELEEHLVKLENNNSKLILKRFCENDEDEDVKFIKNVLNGGEWMVAAFIEGDDNKTEDYNDYSIDFKENGGILVEGNGQEIKGAWFVLRDDGHLKLELNFGSQSPLDEFNHRWKILEISENRIELVEFTSTGNIERKLVLEK